MEKVLQELEEEFDYLIGQMGVTFDHDELMKLSGKVVSTYRAIQKIKGGNEVE